jgi:pimeloyl-ACP methyl ester carboxylesterase
MSRILTTIVAVGILVGGCEHAARAAESKSVSTEVPFKSHEGYDMLGKLVVPNEGVPKAIALYVQNAEGTTADMRRGKNSDEAFNYFDLYRSELTARNIGFFSYEGRGIRAGTQPPRFETIDWEVFNTGTIDNKIRDVHSAIAAVRQQPGYEAVPICLIGSSEGSLIASEAASASPESVTAVAIYSVMVSNLRETFTFCMTDGAFLQHRLFFDADEDRRISKAEYETDPRGVRSGAFKDIPFGVFDTDSDGFYTVDEASARAKPLVDAINNDDYDVLQAWAKAGAAVAVPKGWFKDHFEHRDLWASLSTLDIPVGVFHGALDANAPVAEVKSLEEHAKRQGKTNIDFHYFDDVGHSLGIEAYFRDQPIPEGHLAIFDFIERVAADSRRP